MKKSALLGMAAVVLGCGVVLAQEKNVVPLAQEEQDFVLKAASGGHMEVKLGEMAKEKAQNEKVKAFGERMVKDHGKANDELKQIMDNRGIKHPETLMEKHQKAVDMLKDKSGAEFDKAYMKHMVMDHQEDIQEYEKATKMAKNEQLKKYAERTVEVLREHLKMAKETAKAVGVDVDKMEGGDKPHTM